MRLVAACFYVGSLLLCTVSLEGDQQKVSATKIVNTLRLLNTHEYSYNHENHRFADREQIIASLRQKNLLSKAQIDLENPSPYELAVTVSSDGMHYQITLQRLPDMNDKRTWWEPAAFSDDKGVIFLGKALDCEDAPR